MGGKGMHANVLKRHLNSVFCQKVFLMLFFNQTSAGCEHKAHSIGAAGCQSLQKAAGLKLQHCGLKPQNWKHKRHDQIPKCHQFFKEICFPLLSFLLTIFFCCCCFCVKVVGSFCSVFDRRPRKMDSDSKGLANITKCNIASVCTTEWAPSHFWNNFQRYNRGPNCLHWISQHYAYDIADV